MRCRTRCNSVSSYRSSLTAPLTSLVLEVFQESIHPHVDIPEGWNPRGYWAEKMSYALADPMWFAGTIAFASAMKQKALTGQSKKSSEVMRYSGKAIAGLRNRIAADKSRVDDLALLTIISLMSADVSPIKLSVDRQYSISSRL